MLLDPEIALPHVPTQGAFPAHTGLLVSLERSGCATRRPTACARPSCCRDVGAAGVRRLGGTGAKLLVRLRADREDADGANAARDPDGGGRLRRHHLLLVVEVLVYRLDDEDAARLRGATRRPDP